MIDDSFGQPGLDARPAVSRLVDMASRTSPAQVSRVIDFVRELVSAQAARLYVADYSLRRLQELNDTCVVGPPRLIAGTLAGRAFTGGQIIVSEATPRVVLVPLIDGTNGIGLLELDFDSWDDGVLRLLEPLVPVLVLLLVSRSRFSDQWVRARRSEPLSAAAEIQWDLLPPLSCTTPEVTVGGILEPAYAIGGDSFDYAFNGERLEFAIVDAIGHGMSAVLMSAAAINGFRNARRAEVDLAGAYRRVDDAIATQFGQCYYVTAQLGSLDARDGLLTWVNAGHVPPMLVRNGTYAGELVCAPSKPLGLGGPVVEIATEPLQRGDRVLFYTDGITESRAADGAYFGQDRLADFLVRATLERVPVAETARRLSASVVDYVGSGLKDDATLLLIEYSGHGTPE